MLFKSREFFQGRKKISLVTFDFLKFSKQLTENLPALRRAGRKVVWKFSKISREC